MSAVVVSRKQRLRALEDQVRKNYEAFVATGFALKEIRDDELYKEDGFETWDAYLKQRVAQEFGIERAQAFNLITCAQVRGKLPEIKSSTLDLDDGWSQRELLEFARLAPKDETRPAHPRDLDRLKRKDVERVAKKVVEHCEKEGIKRKRRGAVVRQFVDDDLGIDRAKVAKQTKERRELERTPELYRYLDDMTGGTRAQVKKLETVDEEVWALLWEEYPGVMGRFGTACERLALLWTRVRAQRPPEPPGLADLHCLSNWPELRHTASVLATQSGALQRLADTKEPDRKAAAVRLFFEALRQLLEIEERNLFSLFT